LHIFPRFLRHTGSSTPFWPHPKFALGLRSADRPRPGLLTASREDRVTCQGPRAGPMTKIARGVPSSAVYSADLVRSGNGNGRGHLVCWCNVGRDGTLWAADVIPVV